MKIEFDIDLSELERTETKDGLIGIKVPKDKEERFKMLNLKHKKKLSLYTRKFIIELIDKIEERDSA